MSPRYAQCRAHHQWASWLTLLALVPACQRDDRSALFAGDKSRAAPLSLRQTYDHLRDAYARAAYMEMRPHIEPAQREDVIDLLVAVDGLTAANTAALMAVERACPEMPRGPLDLAAVITDNLEIFSRQIKIVAQKEGPDEAAITVEIAGEPPPIDLRFRRHEGRWLYVPGPGGRELIAVIRDLTEALSRIPAAVSDGPKTPDDIAREYHLHVAPRLRRIERGG